MTGEPFYKAHWRDIEPVRMSAYRSAFNWDEVTERLFEAADISEGQIVADFGCGPGKIAVELARRVGIDGHVHALDINAEFLATARENAIAARVSNQLTTHHNDGVTLPLSDASLDRIARKGIVTQTWIGGAVLGS